MNTFFARGIAIIVCVLLFPLGVAVALEPGESIVLDPVTGNYKLTYSDEQDDGSKILSHGTFFPATKIVPTINSKFNLDETGAVIYSYSVGSGAQSRQILRTVRFDLTGKVVGSQDLPTDIQTSTVAHAFAVLEANSLALATPGGWRGAISADKNGASRISWHPVDSTAGIPPKGHVKGFGFSSQSLPGLSAAKFEGKREAINGFSGGGPDPDSDISKQIQALYQNDFVVRNAAVPAIAVPSPFDAAVTLERIQTHVHTWIGLKLLDATFSSQLDRYLAAAADAYRRNQPKVAKEDIEKVREMLKKEHQDLGRDEEHESEKSQEKNDDRKSALIDRLAARVLDFDLKYVMKRASGDKDD